MEKINHKGLDVAEAVCYFLKESNIALYQGRIEDFLELVNSIILETEKSKLDPNNPEYSLANGLLLTYGESLRVMLVVCEISTTKSIDLNQISQTRSKIEKDIAAADHYFKESQIQSYQIELMMMKDKLNEVLNQFCR